MKQGFTLIETIAVLLLIAVMMLSAAVALVPLSEGFTQAIQNADTAQKAQLALARISRECITITNVASGSAHAMTYDFLDPEGMGIRHVLSWSGVPGDPVLLENVPLMDGVAGFELRYAASPGSPGQSSWFEGARMILLRLETMAAPAVYTNRISPRNIQGISS